MGNANYLRHLYLICSSDALVMYETFTQPPSGGRSQHTKRTNLHCLSANGDAIATAAVATNSQVDAIALTSTMVNTPKPHRIAYCFSFRRERWSQKKNRTKEKKNKAQTHRSRHRWRRPWNYIDMFVCVCGCQETTVGCIFENISFAFRIPKYWQGA